MIIKKNAIFIPVKRKLLLPFLLFLFSATAHSQGCSDAGFCTMGAMKPDQNFNRRITIKLRSIEFAQYLGRTVFHDYIFNYYTDFNFMIGKKTTAQFKIPYVRVNGPLITTSGIGDISLSATRNIVNKGNDQVNITIGTKIPLGKTDIKTDDGKSLPMYNQQGLGTFDFIFGVSWIKKDWMFAAGYQHAFGITDNSFLWQDWIGHSEEETVRLYPQSNQLKRGEDVMLRAEKNFRFTNWNFNLGLLPIWRLNKDIIQIPVKDDSGNPIEGQWQDKIFDGSDGLALTLLMGGGYQFNVRSGIKIMSGIRLKQRPKNPDGLSRKRVFNIGYVLRF